MRLVTAEQHTKQLTFCPNQARWRPESCLLTHEACCYMHPTIQPRARVLQESTWIVQSIANRTCHQEGRHLVAACQRSELEVLALLHLLRNQLPCFARGPADKNRRRLCGHHSRRSLASAGTRPSPPCYNRSSDAWQCARHVLSTCGQGGDRGRAGSAACASIPPMTIAVLNSHQATGSVKLERAYTRSQFEEHAYSSCRPRRELADHEATDRVVRHTDS